jgi:hypothetical protein
MRIMETGDLEMATAEKTRIEDKQRDARRRRGKKEYVPLWFRAAGDTQSEYDVVEDTHTRAHTTTLGRHAGTSSSKRHGDLEWIFTHEYWTRNWSKCPDLF